VQDEEPCELVTAISERVSCAAGHKQELVRTGGQFHAVQDECDNIVEDKESLGSRDVTVRQWPAAMDAARVRGLACVVIDESTDARGTRTG
jgi:hypothetical protein